MEHAADHMHRIRAFTMLALVLVCAPAGAHAQRDGSSSRPETQRLELEVGEQVTISARDVASYSEGAPGVVEVRLNPGGTQFIIVALRPGVTSLLLIYNDGRQVRYSIQVLDPQATVTATGGVPVRENIRLDLYFIQLEDQYSHQVGVGFPGSIGGRGVGRLVMNLDLLTATVTDATASILNQSLPRLDIAQSSGWVRLLRQAMLVTANGQQASINSGGEVNLLVAGPLTNTIERIEFGSAMEVTPRFDPQTRRIDIQVELDVSELTPPPEAGIPGRTRTRLTTMVNLELGQAIVLGGIVSRSTRQSQSGLPLLSQIPILGVLFGTNSRADANTEAMLLIVPTVVEAVPRAQADRIQEALRIYERYGSIGGPGLGDIELFEPSPPGYE